MVGETTAGFVSGQRRLLGDVEQYGERAVVEKFVQQAAEQRRGLNGLCGHVRLLLKLNERDQSIGRLLSTPEIWGEGQNAQSDLADDVAYALDVRAFVRATDR